MKNGSLYVSKVFVEDAGKYGCMAGNNGGLEREEAYLRVNSGNPFLSRCVRWNAVCHLPLIAYSDVLVPSVTGVPPDVYS